MRIRNFSAPTIAEAMTQVRAAMGGDAIIVSTYQRGRGRGVEVTAAIEPDAMAPPKAKPQPAARPPQADRAASTEVAQSLARALSWHGVPGKLIEPLCVAAAAFAHSDREMCLASALDASFGFSPLPQQSFPQKQPHALMLIGPAGAGKTALCAKLAARAVFAGQTVRVITTDTVRAGGIDQLQALTQLMQVPLLTAANPGELRRRLDHRGDHGGDLGADTGAKPDCVLIDTAGVNPFEPTELDDLKSFLGAGLIETQLVLAAGMDADDAADQAAALAALKPARLFSTRLDAARRYGALISAANAADLAFAEVSISPFVAQGLTVLNPVSFAKLLLRDPGLGEVQTVFRKASGT
jgi:flagellar biosynthesis protein FlhF